MEKISFVYKNSRIEFDTQTEEWVAFLNLEYLPCIDEFNRDKSLQKLKDSVDKFNKKKYTPIPIIFFNSNGVLVNAEIISFTIIPGQCWIKYVGGIFDGRKEKINTEHKHIYTTENIFNEPKLLEIIEFSTKIENLQKAIKIAEGEKIRLISSLDKFDITGYALSYVDDEKPEE